MGKDCAVSIPSSRALQQMAGSSGYFSAPLAIWSWHGLCDATMQENEAGGRCLHDHQVELQRALYQFLTLRSANVNGLASECRKTGSGRVSANRRPPWP